MLILQLKSWKHVSASREDLCCGVAVCNDEADCGLSSPLVAVSSLPAFCQQLPGINYNLNQ